MGGKESKQFPLTYDEAVKRGIWTSKTHLYLISMILVSEAEKRRLQDAFRRSSAANSNISKQVSNESRSWNDS